MVKVFCPKCLESDGQSEECLQEIKDNIIEVKAKVEENSAENQRSYSAVVKKQIETNVKDTHALVKDLVNRREPADPDEIVKKNKRTRIVRKPLDKEIRNSSNIRKVINKEFPGVAIRNCRTTVAGSILVEFDSDNEANLVESGWNKEWFGGNQGIWKVEEIKTMGIVKHINADQSVEAIENEVKEKNPGAKCDLFKRPDESFTGTMKVTFADEGTLK